MKNCNKTVSNLPHFLADTWWYALTKRLNDFDFLRLVKTRQKQGFTAAQIVVGIPPEVGIENENAKSIYGSAFDIHGNINKNYIEFAKKRIQIMNKHNITAIIYGSWGYQIDWIGTKRMCDWWNTIIKEFNDFDVIYCLTGEIDLWCNPLQSKILLPDKTTSNITLNILKTNLIDKLFHTHVYKKRINKWIKVLNYINNLTTKPILVHTLPVSSAFNIIKNHSLLSANTFQTGHTLESENSIWNNIYESKKVFPNTPAINLEPWYEGINNNFNTDYQIKAFWLSVSSGAHAICYGAHGIWNVGDGKFLSQWGTQTFEKALSLKTPELLSKSFKIILEKGVFNWNNIDINFKENKLISITRISENGEKMIYIPEIIECESISSGEYFNIEKAEYVSTLPNKGSIVIFTKQ